MFRTMVLAGLIAYRQLHRGAECRLHTSASDEQPRGPIPVHGNKSHWLLIIEKGSSAPTCEDRTSSVT